MSVWAQKSEGSDSSEFDDCEPEDMHQILPGDPSTKTGALYLGNLIAGRNQPKLQATGINSLVTALPDHMAEDPHLHDINAKQFLVCLEDDSNSDIYQYFIAYFE